MGVVKALLSPQGDVVGSVLVGDTCDLNLQHLLHREKQKCKKMKKLI